MLAAGRVARNSRPALCAKLCAFRWAHCASLAASNALSGLGALRLSRGQQCAQRIAHRWAHCASLAASNALSGLGALRLSRGQQCAQRIAHRWAHCASLAASNALSGSLTAGRIAPLSRPAMRSADRSPLGALRLSRGQQCAQRIAHRWAHCASLAASNALSGSLTAGRIAPLSRPAMRSADRSPLGALRLSRGQQCAQRIAHRWAHCASLAASNALSGSLTAGRIAPLSRPAMRSADRSPLGALRLSLQRYSPCGISAAWRIAVPSRPALCAQRRVIRWAHCASLAANAMRSAVFAGFFASQPFRFEPYDLLTNIVKVRPLPHFTLLELPCP
ncbi:unnamed protein product [Closterium sp. Naga37s-1]|nr:unnamed protein product [Closterium sp. Naga37s-1]